MVQAVLGFIEAQQAWAPLIVLVLACGESLAVISLLLPATAVLLGLSGLLAAGGVAFWPCWLGAMIGAVLGDAISYWIGLRFRPAVAHVWPLTRYPQLLPRGERLLQRWGVWAVFFGRFLGPLRAVMPLVAGGCAMPAGRFQLANVGSAVVWATGVLSPGWLAAMLWG